MVLISGDEFSLKENYLLSKVYKKYTSVQRVNEDVLNTDLGLNAALMYTLCICCRSK